MDSAFGLSVINIGWPIINLEVPDKIIKIVSLSQKIIFVLANSAEPGISSGSSLFAKVLI